MLFKSIFTNSIGTLFSRLLGFTRDMMTASILGANIWSDIFFIAFKIPNLFRTIFAEGAFTQAFIPSFAKARHKGEFASLIFFRLLGFLTLFSLGVTIFAAPFTALIAFGYNDDIIAKAAPLVAINFYYLDLIFGVTFLGALLQYQRHFATTAFSTGLLNIAMILSLLLAKGKAPDEIVVYLSWGVVAGGVLQLLTHIKAASSRGICTHLVLGARKVFKGSQRAKEEAKLFNKSFWPSILGSSTAQISAFIDTILGTFLATGSISYLYYANRIFQLPLALFAIATATALFPMIARAIKNNDQPQAEQLLKKSVWILLFLLSMSALGGSLLSVEIMHLLFERGAFTRQDTFNSAIVLSMYLIGLLPFGIAKIFNLWLYSHHRQAQAAKISATSLGFNIFFSLALFTPLGASGLALAGSLTGCVLLFLTLRAFGWDHVKRIFYDPQRLLLLGGALVVLSTLIMVLKHYFPHLVV